MPNPNNNDNDNEIEQVSPPLIGNSASEMEVKLKLKFESLFEKLFVARLDLKFNERVAIKNIFISL